MCQKQAAPLQMAYLCSIIDVPIKNILRNVPCTGPVLSSSIEVYIVNYIGTGKTKI